MPRPEVALELVGYAARTADLAASKRDASLRDIAAESGMSHVSVQRIVERDDN